MSQGLSPGHGRKDEPPPLRQGGGSGRKAGPAGGTAPMWGRGHVLGYGDAAPAETLRELRKLLSRPLRLRLRGGPLSVRQVDRAAERDEAGLLDRLGEGRVGGHPVGDRLDRRL